MLKWITSRVYNRGDALVIAIVSIAISDGRYVSAFVIAVVGAIASGALETWSALRATRDGDGGRDG